MSKIEGTHSSLIHYEMLTDTLVGLKTVAWFTEGREVSDACLVLPSVHINISSSLERVEWWISIDFVVLNCDNGVRVVSDVLHRHLWDREREVHIDERTRRPFKCVVQAEECSWIHFTPINHEVSEIDVIVSLSPDRKESDWERVGAIRWTKVKCVNLRTDGGKGITCL